MTPQITWDIPQPQSSPSQGISWDSNPTPKPQGQQKSLSSELFDLTKGASSLIYTNMLKLTGSEGWNYAYQQHDQIEKQLSEWGDFKQRIAKAATVKDDPLYMIIKGKGPEPFQSQDMLENFIHDMSEFAGDPVLWGPALLGALAGPLGSRVGTTAGFALDQGLRKALADHYTRGDAKSFGELAGRAGSALWEAVKGAVTGEAMGLAGRLPVGRQIAKSPIAETLLRGLYQTTAMTTVGSVLDWQVPRLDDFTRNGVAVTGLNLIVHAAGAAIPNSKQALIDVYAKDGTLPRESATKLQAQPPVKDAQPKGLVPAIQLESGEHIAGTKTESHSDVAERIANRKPVSMDELESGGSIEGGKLGGVSTKSPWEMTYDELDQAFKDDRANDRQTLVDVFGDEESAKRYERLQRKANSTTASFAETDKASEQLTEMEGKLNQDQQDRLYGQGKYATKYTYEDYQEFRDAIGRIGGDTAQELGASLRWAITKVGDVTADTVDRARPDEQVAFAQIRRGLEIAQEKGFDGGEVMKAAIEGAASRFSDPEDAALMLDRFLKPKESNPQLGLAGEVLSNPEVHEQSVIDRANEIVEGQASFSGMSDERLPLRNAKSGRGFQSPDGKFLSREQAKSWVKQNEPEVYDMWQTITGDPKAEMHSGDYQEARKRIADRAVVEGEPQLTATGQLKEFLATNRTELNKIKASDNGGKYGAEVLLTTYAGSENMVRTQVNQVADDIAKLVPSSVDQEALSFMRDYRENPAALQEDIEKIRSGNNERLKQAIPAMERALNPTPKMLQADSLMTQYFTDTNDMRQFIGKGSTIDPSRYSPRNFVRLEDEEASGSGSGPKFTTRSPHDIARQYLNLLDPLKSGEIVARTFNAVDELRVYGDRLAKSVAGSVFQMELKNTELGKYGARFYTDPVSGERIQRYPADWVELPGTGRNIVVTDPETGENIQMHQGLRVPSWVADAMKPVLEADALNSNKAWKSARLAQAFVKSLQVGLSPFHLRAMAISFANNANLDAFWKAKTMQIDSAEFQSQERKFALRGLTTSKGEVPYEAYQGMKPSSLEDRSGFLATIKKGYAPVDSALKAVTELTFDKGQRFFKVVDASGMEAQWLAKNPNATESQYEAALRSISKEVNSVYGGLNWKVMGVSPTHLNIARMFLLAPDWTFSNIANVKYGLTEGATPAGKASRQFLLRSFSTGYVMTQGMSLMLTGQPSKHWNEVYLGKDDKGKEMYSSMFFAGMPKDMITLGNNVARDGVFVGIIDSGAAKLGPLAGTLEKLKEGKDYRGKPIFKKGEDALDRTIDAAKFGASNLLPAPFQWKDLATDLADPNSDITYKDFMVGVLLGSPVKHVEEKQQKSGRFTITGGRGQGKGFKLAGAR